MCSWNSSPIIITHTCPSTPVLQIWSISKQPKRTRYIWWSTIHTDLLLEVSTTFCISEPLSLCNWAYSVMESPETPVYRLIKTINNSIFTESPSNPWSDLPPILPLPPMHTGSNMLWRSTSGLLKKTRNNLRFITRRVPSTHKLTWTWTALKLWRPWNRWRSTYQPTREVKTIP